VGLKGEVITEMAELAEAGCIGFSQAGAALHGHADAACARCSMRRTFGFTVWLQPQDPHLSRGGVAHSGPVASRLGLPGVPVIAETVALHTIFEVVRGTGCTGASLPALLGGGAWRWCGPPRQEGLPRELPTSPSIMCT
jgi:dihydroorotase